jgi:hypothetical protein
MEQNPTRAQSIRSKLGGIKYDLEQEGSYTSKRSGKTITRLGNPNGAEHLKGRYPAEALAHKQEQVAAETERCVAAITEILRDKGYLSMSRIARELWFPKVPTPLDGEPHNWHPNTVRRILVRHDPAPERTWSVSPADSGHGSLIWTMPGRSAG